MNPQISVIIPTYNRANVLKKSIDSILLQTYQDFEIIIVDDGSKDDTEKVISGVRDKRIKYIRYTKNKGRAFARNIGLKHAKARYIAFQDSDDESLTYRLEKQKSILDNNTNIDIVYGDMIRINGDINFLIKTPQLSESPRKARDLLLSLEAEAIGIGTCMIRKECFNRIGDFDINLDRLEDLDWFIRATLQRYRFLKVDKPLIKYKNTDRDEIKIASSAASSRKYILNKYFQEIARIGALSTYYFKIGNELCYSGNISEGRKYLFKAIKLNWKSPKLWIAMLMSTMGHSFYSKSIRTKNSVLEIKHRVLSRE